jgi:MazG family protein
MSEDGREKRPTGELFAELVKTVGELRRQCPWDREQTLETLARYLVEEAYEACEAIAGGRPDAVSEELGDLLAQIVFHAVVAEERGLFTLAELLSQAREKLIRRHPHVYGAEPLDSAEEVVRQWDAIKREERKQAGAGSALGDGAGGLPAVLRAEKLGRRARVAGMDWPDLRAVLAKTREELDEAEAVFARGELKDADEELGDALLALANAPRFLGASAEQTLRRACDKFVARFTELERLADQRRLALNQLSPRQIEELWQEAKQRLAANRARSEP